MEWIPCGRRGFSISPLATAVTPSGRAVSRRSTTPSISIFPYRDMRATALATRTPGWLAILTSIPSVRARHARFRRRRGRGRSISRLGQPVSMLVLVGGLPALGRRSECCRPDLSKILGFRSLLLLRELCDF